MSAARSKYGKVSICRCDLYAIKKDKRLHIGHPLTPVNDFGLAGEVPAITGLK